MDVSRTAEAAMLMNRAMAAQEMSVAMVKQQLQAQQAVGQMVEQATSQSKAAAGAVDKVLDILV